MSGQERRLARRFIMKVPLRFRPMREAPLQEETASSMNISTHGVYFATEQKISQGLLVQVHLKMPRQIAGDNVEEWSFTGRVAHVEPLSARNGKCGVGVQFLFYEVPPASIDSNATLRLLSTCRPANLPITECLSQTSI